MHDHDSISFGSFTPAQTGDWRAPAVEEFSAQWAPFPPILWMSHDLSHLSWRQENTVIFSIISTKIALVQILGTEIPRSSSHINTLI
jgi:hypothetical protein